MLPIILRSLPVFCAGTNRRTANFPVREGKGRMEMTRSAHQWGDSRESWYRFVLGDWDSNSPGKADDGMEGGVQQCTAVEL